MRVETLVIILLITLVIASISPALASEEAMVFIGLGEEEFFPMIDGAELVVKTGESIYALSIGGLEELRLMSPSGSEEKVILDGSVKLVKRFDERDEEGFWTLSTQKGVKINLIHRRPVDELKVAIDFRIKDTSTIVLELRPERGVFAFFSYCCEGIIVRPGEKVNIRIDDATDHPYVIELLDPERKLSLEGRLNGGVDYSVYASGLIGRWILYPVENGGSRSVSFILPKLHHVGNDGVFPLTIGPKIIRISVMTGVSVIERRTFPIIVVPNEVDGRFFATKLEMGLNDSSKPIDIVVGNEVGDVKSIRVMLPIATLRTVSSESVPVKNIDIILENATVSLLDDFFVVMYYQTLMIDPRADNNPIMPTRFVELKITSNGVPVTKFQPRLLFFRPGDEVLVRIQAHNLTINLVDQMGRLFDEPTTIEIDGYRVPIKGGRASFLLDEGKHVISTFLHVMDLDLTENKEVTITIYRSLELVASLIVIFVAQVVALIFLLKGAVLKVQRVHTR